MGILDWARQDAQTFTTDPAGFGVAFTLTAPGNSPATLSGYCTATRHNTNVDGEGYSVNAPLVSITIAIGPLEDADYPYRNDKNEVALIGHLITCEDKNYKIQNTRPDETLQLIVCVLTDKA